VFTGLVAEVGDVIGFERTHDGARLTVAATLAQNVADGDSVAVNGVCLTAIGAEPGSFSADVMNETLARSSLGSVGKGSHVNLELALRASDRLGGHIMQGHVDGVGTIAAVVDDGFARRVTVDAPEDVLRYVVEKGSIAVDGVSLTVAGVDSRSFTVSLIPETLERTTFGDLEPGATVNLEVDVLAKYVEKLIVSRDGEHDIRPRGGMPRGGDPE
jgi:riboflavin synthase